MELNGVTRFCLGIAKALARRLVYQPLETIVPTRPDCGVDIS
jgi:hypothetical protein